MIRSVPARIGLVLGLALAGTISASAQEGTAFKDLMGTIGILPKSKESITYRERAPLVLPPKSELRAPGTRSSAASNPAWPNDPDVAARRRAAEEGASPVTWSETRRMSSEGNLRLTPKEIQAGRVASQSGTVPGSHRGDNARDVLLVNPDELRARRSASADDELPVGVEPPRKNLTDPPSGMRKWAGGKAIKGDFAPRIDEQSRDANPMNWLTRKFGNDDE